MIIKFLLMLLILIGILCSGIFIICSTLYLLVYLNEKGSNLFVLTPIYLLICIDFICWLGSICIGAVNKL